MADALSQRGEIGGPSIDPHVTPNLSVDASPTADRREAHNASVDIDEDAAEEGACAQVHLPTGRMCTLQYDQEGSCDFGAPTR